VRITLPSGTSAELARAESGNDTGIGIALHPDIMGLRDLFDEHTARLASDGFTTCAIEPWPGQEDLPLDKRMSASFDVERVLGDLEAAADATECDRVGVIGFCMGGMQVFRAAGTGRFQRAVSFYGMIVPPEAWRHPGQDPLDMLQKPEACPTLAILGGRDDYTPPDDIEQLRQLSNVEVVVYPEAEHGFVHAPERPSHRADDAADAWARAKAFLTSA
jgi:carboxymethylenebutenolidase